MHILLWSAIGLRRAKGVKPCDKVLPWRQRLQLLLYLKSISRIAD